MMMMWMIDDDVRWMPMIDLMMMDGDDDVRWMPTIDQMMMVMISDG